MLVLSRHVDQAIRITDDITITILEIRGDRVSVGIDAPRHLRIDRQEVWELRQLTPEPAPDSAC